MQLTDEAIVKMNPDVIITTDGVKAAEVEKRADWGAVNAVKHHNVYSVDPDLVTRSGPRLVKGVEKLAESVYPETFKK